MRHLERPPKSTHAHTRRPNGPLAASSGRQRPSAALSGKRTKSPICFCAMPYPSQRSLPPPPSTCTPTVARPTQYFNRLIELLPPDSHLYRDQYGQRAASRVVLYTRRQRGLSLHRMDVGVHGQPPVCWWQDATHCSRLSAWCMAGEWHGRRLNSVNKKEISSSLLQTSQHLTD